MNEESRGKLLKLARETIVKALKGEELLDFRPDDRELEEKCGAFVTLKKKGELRGCIGTFREDMPLWKVIREIAIASAFHDPRFPPLKEDELGDVTIEISVLSPRREIKDISEIEIGKHGLYITKGMRGGVLLPQVAVEHNLTRDEFLALTCRKAGLEPDEWKDKDTKIEIFIAEVFSESESEEGS